MTEEKHGFVHTLLFSLITNKKKKQFKGPKSLKTTISTTIIEKQIKERYKRPDWWGVTKAIFMLGLVFYVGFTIWQTLSSTLEGGLAQNVTFSETCNNCSYTKEITQNITSGEQVSIAPSGFISGFFSIFAVIVIIGVLITLVRVVASPLGGDL